MYEPQNGEHKLCFGDGSKQRNWSGVCSTTPGFSDSTETCHRCLQESRRGSGEDEFQRAMHFFAERVFKKYESERLTKLNET